MKECQTCDIYRTTKGRGNKDCKSCPYYRVFRMRFSAKERLMIVDLSQQVIESIPDDQHAYAIMEGIRKLPREKSMPLMMQYFLGMTVREIAQELKISPQAVQKRNEGAIQIIRRVIEG
jgi:DNA-directed RNA polymerase specialized sigma24 family protein